MLAVLDPLDETAFPAVESALRDPNGLLALGGDLRPQRLYQAYRRGIFPWFNPGDPILWWSPDPRTLLYPGRFHASRSLRKVLRRSEHRVSLDQDFGAVIRACAAPREPGGGTWLVPEMIAAYERLHDLGLAHSVEVWLEGELVGGLYGVAIGGAFFGESMFSRASNGSKIALAHLCAQLHDWNFELIDCQMRTEHLISLGAVEVPRADFIRQLERLCDLPGRPGRWDGGPPTPPRLPGDAELAV